MKQVERLRIDKWLWTARLFTTRSQAAEAVDLGRVRVNGERVKPAREARIGDLVEVSKPQWRAEVMIRALSAQRGSATVAQQLYEETEASRVQREQAIARRAMAAEPRRALKGRPTKRDARALRSLRRLAAD